ncbi:MAG: hypothetical protein AABY22_21285 [Nanoarchaeota archaeon]
MNNEKQFEFNEEEHYYTLDGKRMYGITSVLGVIAKPMLIQWAANEAVRELGWFDERKSINKELDLTNFEKRWEEIKKLERDEFFELLSKARYSHRKKKEKAGDIGHIVHKAIEKWIKESKEPELDEQGMKMFNNFKSWTEKNNIKFLESEKKMYSEELWIAGTMDALIEKDNKKYVLDIKTTGGIYDRIPFFQCAGYSIMLAEHNIEVEGYIIIRIGKDGAVEEFYSYDIEGDKQGFLATLTLFKQLETWKTK